MPYLTFLKITSTALLHINYNKGKFSNTIFTNTQNQQIILSKSAYHEPDTDWIGTYPGQGIGVYYGMGRICTAMATETECDKANKQRGAEQTIARLHTYDSGKLQRRINISKAS